MKIALLNHVFDENVTGTFALNQMVNKVTGRSSHGLRNELVRGISSLPSPWALQATE
jgi:hypothetical protein